jgi:PPP family 3-phenylpropionic acid transporter
MSAKLAVRGNYFFFFMAMGAALPYVTPYFKEVCGFSDRSLGWIAMVRPAVGLLAQPLWCYLADRSGRRSRITALLSLGSALLYPLILLSTSFVPILLTLVAWAFFYSPLMALGDSMAFGLLEGSGRSRYAGLRIYGTVGFMISVGVLGIVFDRTGLRWLFPAFSVAMIAAAASIVSVPATARLPSSDTRDALRVLYRNRNVLVFVGACLLAAMANNMGFIYLSVYAKHLGATNAQVGYLWVVSTGAELVMMFFIGRIVERLGVKRMVLLGVLGVLVRWEAAALADSWWQLLPLQMLHALTFCFLYIGAVTFMDMESPPSVRSSAQALYGTVVLQAGAIMAGAVGGELCQRSSYATVFTVCGALAAFSAVVLALFVRDPSKRPAGA